MGYNTAAIILNDGMDQLKKDPEAGTKIYNGILQAHREAQTISLGNHCNPMMVLPSQHADFTQLVAVGGNYIRPVRNIYNIPYEKDDVIFQELVLERLAHELGFNIAKRRR